MINRSTAQIDPEVKIYMRMKGDKCSFSVLNWFREAINNLKVMQYSDLVPLPLCCAGTLLATLNSLLAAIILEKP